MNDTLHNLLKALDHNRWTYGLLVIAVLLTGFALGLSGCASTVAPPAWIPPHLPVAAPGGVPTTQPVCPAGWPTEPVTRAVYEKLAAQNAANLRSQRAAIEVRAEMARRDAEVRNAELAAQVASWNTRVEVHTETIAMDRLELDRQDEFRGQFVDFLGTVALQGAAGTLNPASLIPLAIGLLGGAWGVGNKLDNRRKDTKIVDLKAEVQAATAAADAKA